MLIITADDFGLDNHATNNILLAYRSNRITCASAMVFMADSLRAAKMSSELDIEVGLHINLTWPFTQPEMSSLLQKHQNAISSYLLKSKLSQLIYNPTLKKSFDLVFRAQEEEFMRLYGRPPAFYNGHQHMHLCANVILGKYLPHDIPIRRTFTFSWGEKNPFNILYRRLLDYYINRRYISTDSFYSLSPLKNIEKLYKIFKVSKMQNVELMVHPNREEEFLFISSDKYLELINRTILGSFTDLKR
ncbi:MAG: ChbG/HpnK family deacetylase [Deferribacterales bacterium]|nr:ChbG/HpnK family deacetylase [Deferribacterales bacterium]